MWLRHLDKLFCDGFSSAFPPGMHVPFLLPLFFSWFSFLPSPHLFFTKTESAKIVANKCNVLWLAQRCISLLPGRMVGKSNLLAPLCWEHSTLLIIIESLGIWKSHPESKNLELNLFVDIFWSLPWLSSSKDVWSRGTDVLGIWQNSWSETIFWWPSRVTGSGW